MKVKKTEKKTKQVDVVIESYTVCDKCNERIEQERFNAFEFNFELKTGSNYPDSGSGERQELDLCKSAFFARILRV